MSTTHDHAALPDAARANPALRLRATERVAASAQDGAATLFDLESERYYHLDEVGTLIWEMVEREATFAELLARLEREYDADPAALEQDSLRFLAGLQAAGLVEVR